MESQIKNKYANYQTLGHNWYFFFLNIFLSFHLVLASSKDAYCADGMTGICQKKNCRIEKLPKETIENILQFISPSSKKFRDFITSSQSLWDMSFNKEAYRLRYQGNNWLWYKVPCNGNYYPKTWKSLIKTVMDLDSIEEVQGIFTYSIYPNLKSSIQHKRPKNISDILYFAYQLSLWWEIYDDDFWSIFHKKFAEQIKKWKERKSVIYAPILVSSLQSCLIPIFHPVFGPCLTPTLRPCLISAFTPIAIEPSRQENEEESTNFYDTILFKNCFDFNNVIWLHLQEQNVSIDSELRKKITSGIKKKSIHKKVRKILENYIKKHIHDAWSNFTSDSEFSPKSIEDHFSLLIFKLSLIYQIASQASADPSFLKDFPKDSSTFFQDFEKNKCIRDFIIEYKEYFNSLLIEDTTRENLFLLDKQLSFFISKDWSPQNLE